MLRPKTGGEPAPTTAPGVTGLANDVTKALRAVDRHHGKVVTTTIPVRDVGRYDAITRGAHVLESPTVLVIGAGGKARAITGSTQAKEIDHAVSDIGGA